MSASLSALARTPGQDGGALFDRAKRLESEGRAPQALEQFIAAAEIGHVPAMAEAGARLVAGAGGASDLPGGIAWLSAAAEHDDPNALTLLATLTAAGVMGAPDWTGALSFLARAAAAGLERARGQLRLLAPAVSAAPEGPDLWPRLAGAVDVAAWIAPPARRPLWESPRVRMAEAFAPPAVCDWLIHRARGRMRPAMMYDGTEKIEKVDPHRTCSDYQFDIRNTDLVLLLVRERISALVKLPTVAMEPPRIFHYARGEQIKAHYDRCGDGVGGYGREGGYLGDRIVTFLLYLNDDYEGGDLDFPKTGFRCRGAKGDGVYFAHVDAAGRPDPLSLHAGLEIRQGEKWVLSQWIHDRPFGVIAPAVA
jgi:hypothetical protein